LRDGRFQQIVNDHEVGRSPSDSSYAELMNYSEDVRSILKQVPAFLLCSLLTLLQMLSPDHCLRPDATFLRHYSSQRLAPHQITESEAEHLPQEALQHQVILSLQERIRGLEAEVETLRRQRE
jgi:hypothetical protein